MPWLLRMTLLVSGIMAVIHLYLGWRLVRAAGFITRRKFLIWLPAVLLFSFYLLPLSTLLLYAAQGDVDVLQFYQPVTYWFWYGFAFTFQLLSWVIVYDVLKMVSHLVFKAEKTLINRSYGWLVVATVLGIAVYTGAKMIRDTTVITTETISVAVQELPDALDGFRIVHVSDIQGDEYTGAEEIAEYVRKVNEQQPDLVIFTGDLISYGTGFIEMAAHEFGKVEATYGVYAVVGDHDFWAGLSYIEPALEKHGIPLLRNENKIIYAENSRLLLTGITQVYSKQITPDGVKALTSDSARVSVKILASHQMAPLLIEQALQHGYNLLLAGHTHGGQVRVPLFWTTFSAADLETSYLSGSYREEDLFINVNNGLGFTLAPVRYNAPPGITVIELRGE